MCISTISYIGVFILFSVGMAVAYHAGYERGCSATEFKKDYESEE